MEVLHTCFRQGTLSTGLLMASIQVYMQSVLLVFLARAYHWPVESTFARFPSFYPFRYPLSGSVSRPMQWRPQGMCMLLQKRGLLSPHHYQAILIASSEDINSCQVGISTLLA